MELGYPYSHRKHFIQHQMKYLIADQEDGYNRQILEGVISVSSTSLSMKRIRPGNWPVGPLPTCFCWLKSSYIIFFFKSPIKSLYKCKMTCVLIVQMRRVRSESSQKSYKTDFCHATSNLPEPKLLLLTFLRTLSMQ